MIGRLIITLTLVSLLATLLSTFSSSQRVSAQDPLPTPVGHLGGPMPLPTAPGLPAAPLPLETPRPPQHSLVGTWIFTFAERDQAPAQVVFGDDGLASFADGEGNQGAGVWIPRGEHEGVLAVGIRADERSSQPPIMMLQAQIAVAISGDDATVRYTIEAVDESGAAPERSGPFTAVGQRVSREP